ncbi:MAG: hypothetical protein KDD64_00250 [Bdellovibrionales bacterium]|nr:hypothetical protein [Bdellovibrionales bacterium]
MVKIEYVQNVPLLTCFSALGIFIGVSFFTGCGPVLSERTEPAPHEEVPIAQSEAEGVFVLEETGKNILYGEDLGDLGAAILFFPYGIYKLGQTAAGFAGYELDAKRAFSPEVQDGLSEVYDSTIALPGKAAAAVAGEEYRGKGSKIDLEKFRRENQQEPRLKPSGE